jgi:hypothetical protein
LPNSRKAEDEMKGKTGCMGMGEKMEMMKEMMSNMDEDMASMMEK